MSDQMQLFVYADLDISGNDESYIEARAKRIDDAKQAAITSILDIGQNLTEVQKRLANHGNGTFGKWIEQRCGFSKSSAYKYISAHETFGKVCPGPGQTISSEALYRLSSDSCPEAATKKAIRLAQKGEQISDSRAKEIIEEFTVEAEEDEDEVDPDDFDDLPDYDPMGWSIARCQGDLRLLLQKWHPKCPTSAELVRITTELIPTFVKRLDDDRDLS